MTIAILAAFHTTFILMLKRANATNWIDTPAAVVLAVAHVSAGSFFSAWLARMLPRAIGVSGPRWLSFTAVSFVLAVGASAWLGWTTFSLIPTQWMNLNFGFMGLFLSVPASIWFWQLGKTLSW